jgi:outer membrane protein
MIRTRSVAFFLLGAFLCAWCFPFLSQAEEDENILSLEDAYRLALETHEGVMIAGKEVEKSKLLPKKALSVMLPLITGEGGYRQFKDPIGYKDIIETVPEKQWQGSIEFSQPVYNPNFFPLRKQASQTINRDTEGYLLTNQEILFQVAEAYYQVLEGKELVQSAREILTLAEEGLRVSQSKAAAGAVTEDVVLKSELSVTSAQSKIIETNNQLALAKDVLKRLIGKETLAFDVAKPAELKGTKESYESLIEVAFDQRHDYRAAIFETEIAKSAVQVAKAKFYPTLDGVWAFHKVDNPALTQEKDFWVATLQIKLPIFERSLPIWDLKEKNIALQQSNLALEGLNKSIRLEIRDAMLSVETYGGTLENSRKQVDLAQKNYEIVFSQFKYGAATSLELNQALTTLDTAKTDLITRTFGYQVSLLSVEKATGLFASEFIKTNMNKGKQ